MEYKLITERSHLYCPNVHICFMAELTQVFDAEAIRAAVLNTMKKHPILRSYVQMDDAGLSYLHITDCSEPEISEEPLPSNEDWSEIVMREQKNRLL